MEKHSSLIFIICLICLSPISAQDHSMKQVQKEEAEELIRVLSTEIDTSQLFKNTLSRAITHYHLLHYYLSEETHELFSLIFRFSHKFKNEYYRFLALNAELFSESEMELINQDLPLVLDKSDYPFYEIVSLYHLDVNKQLIVNETKSNFFTELRNFFRLGFVPVGLLEDVRPYTTLANLGDSVIEDSLISIINEFYLQCTNSTDTLRKASKYSSLYIAIIPQILGRLKSKRSIGLTKHLLLDTHEFAKWNGEEMSGKIPAYDYYIKYALLPKISIYHRGEILKMLDGPETDQLPKEEYNFIIYNRIKNNEIVWNKTLIDVGK